MIVRINLRYINASGAGLLALILSLGSLTPTETASAQSGVCTPEQLAAYDICHSNCEADYWDNYYECELKVSVGVFTCFTRAQETRDNCNAACAQPFCPPYN